MSSQTLSSDHHDQRGFARRVKTLVPQRVYRMGVVSFNAVMSSLPPAVKYGASSRIRRTRAPYSVLHEGDVAVQIGAPRDILAAGRSRSIHFALLVGPKGRVHVFEADPKNIEALEAYVAKNGLHQIVVHPYGAWSETTTLSFLASDTHPASNLVNGVRDLSHVPTEYREYRTIEVPVKSLDEVIPEEDQKRMRLVSITTNGSELEILKGMQTMLSRTSPFISLAKTGKGYVEAMVGYGYQRLADDDRGYFFSRSSPLSP